MSTQNLALLTDLYELTMAYGYWKLSRERGSSLAERQAVFHLSFRNNPFAGGFAIAAGLESVIDYLRHFQVTAEDAAYLGTLTGNDGKALFDAGFLRELEGMRVACDIDAVPEGTVIFGHEPLVRVRGPLLQCQLLETALLTLVNFETLIATKAARVTLAARGEPILEFGLRRAQGIDGGITASRAAYLGGCAATSNVLAGKRFGIPVKGTHAHSWVMCFDDEADAFEAWAEVMPNNCTLLVDTYNTLEGVRHAVQTFLRLRARGHKPAGIRLDSGDLAYLSIEARKILDEAGLREVPILASNDLDETIIRSLKEQGAAITIWGVGTKLVTAYDQPALGGVYKLSALQQQDGSWGHKIKLSEQKAKTSIPGILQVRRFRGADGRVIGDMIYDELTTGAGSMGGGTEIIDIVDVTRKKPIAAGTAFEDLLQPIFRGGKLVYESPPLERIRERTLGQLQTLHPGILRSIYPHEYPVGLEPGLNALRNELILRYRRPGGV
ncbi:MAG TPA: nicotinate phosphoribosyltransferase [Phycisphaerae bacterium]|nr:nicotinate phosphoribosyltransferase [Phycisphaerae bacterium]